MYSFLLTRVKYCLGFLNTLYFLLFRLFTIYYSMENIGPQLTYVHDFVNVYATKINLYTHSYSRVYL